MRYPYGTLASLMILLGIAMVIDALAKIASGQEPVPTSTSQNPPPDCDKKRASSSTQPCLDPAVECKYHNQQTCTTAVRLVGIEWPVECIGTDEFKNCNGVRRVCYYEVTCTWDPNQFPNPPCRILREDTEVKMARWETETCPGH
jgi:hypothetical protein